jgi:hypothetical protein
MTIIPAMGRLRQEDDDFEDSVSYMVRHCGRVGGGEENEEEEKEK